MEGHLLLHLVSRMFGALLEQKQRLGEADYCAATYPGQDFHIPARCKRWVYVR